MNIPAILAATAVGIGVGMVWYMPNIFGAIWMKELKLDPKKMNKDSAKQAYLFTIAGALVSAIVLGQFIRAFSTSPSAGLGGLVGFLAGAGLVAPAFLTNYLFEGKSQRLFFVTAGHHVVALTIMGIVLGLLS